MGKSNGGNDNSNGSGGFNIGAVLGIVSLIIALDIPMFTWIQSNSTTVNKLDEELHTHIHENNRDALEQGKRQGEVDQLIKDRGDVIEKLTVSLQRQIRDQIDITEAKLAALDQRLQQELHLAVAHNQDQINDSKERVENLREKKVELEREVSELKQQTRALERETFKGQLAPLGSK